MKHPAWILMVGGSILLWMSRICASPIGAGEVVQQALASPTGSQILPVQTGSTPAATPTSPPPASDLVQAADIEYLGAFRLPAGSDRPATFAYGGAAITYNPDGDPGGASDGLPGSLFIMGHDRLPYGELPDGNQVAEVNIPAAVNSSSLEALNRAEFLQDFQDIAQGAFTSMSEIPRAGMQYLNHAATGPLIHLAWSQHLEIESNIPTYAWFSPNLTTPNLQGAWWIGSQTYYTTGGYLFEIPAAWADANAAGRYLATGRFRDGGWSGMGPTLFAYRPWVDEAGAPAQAGAHLPETVLLLYENSTATNNIERCLAGYQHPDEWEGGAWITTVSGNTAVLFAGTKSTGSKYWYGYVNPAGPDAPCVDVAHVGEFTVCRLADGSRCPESDLTGCSGHNDYRGWWSTRYDAQFILYDPADLQKVAAGQMEPWQPQPYASIDIDEHLFLNPAGVETDLLGAGNQRRYRLSEITFDRANGLLYVLEIFADDAQPVVHVWRIH